MNALNITSYSSHIFLTTAPISLQAPTVTNRCHPWPASSPTHTGTTDNRIPDLQIEDLKLFEGILITSWPSWQSFKLRSSYVTLCNISCDLWTMCVNDCQLLSNLISTQCIYVAAKFDQLWQLSWFRCTSSDSFLRVFCKICLVVSKIFCQHTNRVDCNSFRCMSHSHLVRRV